jgi:ElaB/YqjD/DUF883 family membrane-anchored ribosome-binding protein
MSASANPIPSSGDGLGSRPDAVPPRPMASSDLTSDFGSTAGASGVAGEMMSRVVSGAHHTIDRLAETAAPHVDRLQHMGEDMHLKADHLREVGDEWTQSMRTAVRDHPLAAVAVALALGVLIARVTR